jgi:hypothetical protein
MTVHMTLKLQNLDTIVADLQAGRTVTSQVGTDTVRKAIRAANF